MSLFASSWETAPAIFQPNGQCHRHSGEAFAASENARNGTSNTSRVMHFAAACDASEDHRSRAGARHYLTFLALLHNCVCAEPFNRVSLLMTQSLASQCTPFASFLPLFQCRNAKLSKQPTFLSSSFSTMQNKNATLIATSTPCNATTPVWMRGHVSQFHVMCHTILCDNQRTSTLPVSSTIEIDIFAWQNGRLRHFTGWCAGLQRAQAESHHLGEERRWRGTHRLSKICQFP